MSGAPAGLAPPIGAGRGRTVRVVGISGSLRRGSLNTALLRAAVADAPDWVELEIVSIGDLPLYNADLEADPPAPVVRLRAAVAAADAILLATPEYNYSIPGTLKNAVDWISRPRRNAGVDGKPVAMMGAGGVMGTARAQLAWLPVFQEVGLRPVLHPEIYIARGAGFEGGELVDPALHARIRAKLVALAEAVTAVRPA